MCLRFGGRFYPLGINVPQIQGRFFQDENDNCAFPDRWLHFWNTMLLKSLIPTENKKACPEIQTEHAVSRMISLSEDEVNKSDDIKRNRGWQYYQPQS